MLETITCERFHDGAALHDRTRLVIDDGVVVAIEPSQAPGDVPLIAPGLVDLQVNGWDAVDVAEGDAQALSVLGQELLKMGTTSWLGTLITAPLGTMRERIEKLDSVIASGAAQGLVGLHLEGPFLGAAPGAHRRRHIIPVDHPWLDALPTSVRLITLAPECEGALDAIPRLVERGIRVSLGHSLATEEQLDAASRAGASMVTHLFNGMSGVHHREGGVALWALTNPGVRLGLIADLVHVSARTVSLAFGAGDPSRVLLVSDSIAWRSAWAVRNGVAVSNGAPRLPDGTLAGSSTPLSECLRRAVTSARVNLADAVVAATARPADQIGRGDLGRIRVGHPADMVMFDSGLHVMGVRTRLPSARAHTFDH